MISRDARFDDRFYGGPVTVVDIYKMNHMYNCPITTPQDVKNIFQLRVDSDSMLVIFSVVGSLLAIQVASFSLMLLVTASVGTFMYQPGCALRSPSERFRYVYRQSHYDCPNGCLSD